MYFITSCKGNVLITDSDCESVILHTSMSYYQSLIFLGNMLTSHLWLCTRPKVGETRQSIPSTQFSSPLVESLDLTLTQILFVTTSDCASVSSKRNCTMHEPNTSMIEHYNPVDRLCFANVKLCIALHKGELHNADTVLSRQILNSRHILSRISVSPVLRA